MESLCARERKKDCGKQRERERERERKRKIDGWMDGWIQRKAQSEIGRDRMKKLKRGQLICGQKCLIIFEL